jgi:flagellin-like hook-associated protein FlgL
MAKNQETAVETNAAQPTPGTVNIDGTEYKLDSLSEDARNQLLNIRAVDMEIARLKQLQAIAQTARSAYAAALKRSLPTAEEK